MQRPNFDLQASMSMNQPGIGFLKRDLRGEIRRSVDAVDKIALAGPNIEFKYEGVLLL